MPWFAAGGCVGSEVVGSLDEVRSSDVAVQSGGVFLFLVVASVGCLVAIFWQLRRRVAYDTHDLRNCTRCMTWPCMNLAFDLSRI